MADLISIFKVNKHNLFFYRPCSRLTKQERKQVAISYTASGKKESTLFPE